MKTKTAKPFSELERRMDEKTAFGKPDECWPWTGALGSRGRPVIAISRAKTAAMAQTVLWERLNGKTPKGKCILPTCGNRICMNPSHLAACSRYNRKDKAERFWSKVDKGGPDECWEWNAGRHADGKYGKFWSNEHQDSVAAHRVAWELTHGGIPDGMFVCHECDNPPCCNPSHLFLGTAQDNVDDMMTKDRHAKVGGEQHHAALLTEADVRDIHERRKRGDSGYQIARDTGINHWCIYAVIQGKTWKSIYREYHPLSQAISTDS